jgi:hypothetical protein
MASRTDERFIAYSFVISDFGSGSATSLRDYGSISGTFNAPHRIQSRLGEHSEGGFRMSRTWTFEDLTGEQGPYLAEGTGTATCDPCSVAGRTGVVTFDLTVLGTATLDENGVPEAAENLGGVWTISGATGELEGLQGRGTYSGQQPIVFIGTVTLPW